MGLPARSAWETIGEILTSELIIILILRFFLDEYSSTSSSSSPVAAAMSSSSAAEEEEAEEGVEEEGESKNTRNSTKQKRRKANGPQKLSSRLRCIVLCFLRLIIKRIYVCEGGKTIRQNLEKICTLVDARTTSIYVRPVRFDFA